jgi:hypothetical protein
VFGLLPDQAQAVLADRGVGSCVQVDS